ncbi:MAG: glutathione S-transferase [endosymbiont of Galathealinum brachiosum]|uniref:Glutathione S-transferase n=1 Tax=endosymbiont of Galathealinum brachiosum TaxID=2200906 RepID=A0A370DMC3_9GAMM|nr:MAG: glutathione S-transferase [endosymbiont of Galathealinum brachiosum]
MVILYQFPISHFCEKARWALDYKGIPYKVKNLLPGPHVKQVMSIAKRSEVPVLKHEANIIQHSDKIIDYLDEKFTDHRLTPVDDETRVKALEWEAFVDKEVGPNLRTFFYHSLLDHPKLLIPIFTYKGPWYGKILMKFFFPALRLKMIKLMRINDETALQAKLDLKLAIDKLNLHLSEHKFLAGDTFSRADLAAASLLAPLVQPDKYGLPWPSPLPAALQTTIDEWSGELEWVKQLYIEYR